VKRKNPSATKAEHFSKRVASLCPAIKGSLSLVYKPCIRASCALCASGQKHPAHMLSYTLEGRRRCLYVPADLVPLIQRALENGRKIETLLCQSAAALISQYRKTRDTKPASNPVARPSKTVKKPKC
jgi:hypothetical protein